LCSKLLVNAVPQRERVGNLFKGGLNFLFVINHRLLLANFGQLQVGLISARIKNGNFNFRNKIPHPAPDVKRLDNSVLPVESPLVREMDGKKAARAAPIFASAALS
jgi:hypothetical protein